MIQEYLQEAMEKATYEFLEEEGFYGSAGAAGVWATGATLEECRRELLGVLEEWVLIGLARGDELPAFDDVQLKVELVG